MWEAPLGPRQSENVVNNILAQNSKPELGQYLHAVLFSLTTASLFKSIKQGFLKTCPGLTERLIKKNPEKSFNTTIGQMNMIRQGLQSTKEKPPYTDLEDKIKTNVVYCTTVDPSTTK